MICDREYHQINHPQKGSLLILEWVDLIAWESRLLLRWSNGRSSRCDIVGVMKYIHWGVYLLCLLLGRGYILLVMFWHFFLLLLLCVFITMMSIISIFLRLLCWGFASPCSKKLAAVLKLWLCGFFFAKFALFILLHTFLLLVPTGLRGSSFPLPTSCSC